ncbi:MAG: hypothetical protein K0Q68_1172 [Moraxellaceae bacterium]|jgi:hypothetical protein|nr:hypothetical protein [Moraxellaceae bacterium]
MKKSMVVSAVFAVQAFAAVAHAESMEVALLQEAIFSGKTSLDLRLRGEYVDFETTPETDAETLRTVLGYKTGDYRGLKAFVEFENVSTLGNGEYNSGTTGFGNKQVQYGLIADPALTQMNQAFLEGYGVKYGRQKLIYDNARFIGDVGWRQNDQTFDAVSFANGTWVKDLTLSAAWLKRVNNIAGVSRRVEAPLTNIRYAAFPQARATVFYYGVDEEDAPTTSWQHAGLRVDGTVANFLYELSFADQKDYADSKATAVPDASYTDVQLGYKFGPVTVKLQQEVLEKGFKTPLATLHAFNGWADRFLATPANGLEDSNVKLLAGIGGYNFVLAAHDFRAEATSDKFGEEVDFSVSKALTSKLTGMLKFAEFNGGSVAGFTNDTRKAWLQFAYKM